MNQGAEEPRRTPSARIALLSPRGPLYKHRTGIFRRSLRYAPLTLTTLAALVPPDMNARITLLDEGVDEIDPALDADLVGISAITGTAPRAYELSDHFRRRGIPVVLGGVHPTLMPEEAEGHADAVVVGFAEESWPRLLRDFQAGRMGGRYVQVPELTLGGRPFARRDLLPKDQYVTLHTFEAVRGCLHGCEFCVAPAAWGSRLWPRPVAEVVEEIRQTGAKKLLFLDLNLIADVDFAKELLEALIPLGVRWGGLTTTLVAWDGELLELLRRSGCFGLLLGFESVCAASLEEARKRFNTLQGPREVVRHLHALGIALMGCFAFGFDHDTPEVFEETADFVQAAAIDLPRFAILTPFPGTPLHRRMEAEGRILTKDWGLYDGQHVVFQPARMSPRELLKGTEGAWKRVYGLRAVAHRLLAARNSLAALLPANLAYRFYAHNLHRYYTCGGFTG